MNKLKFIASVNGLCWARARVNGEEQWCALHHQRNDAETNEWPRNDSDEDKFNAFFSARKRNVGGRQTVDKSANKRSTIGKQINGLPLFCTFAPSLERIESEATRKGHSLLRGQVKPPLGFRRRTIVILSSYFGAVFSFMLVYGLVTFAPLPRYKTTWARRSVRVKKHWHIF